MPIGDGTAYEANLAAQQRLIAEFPELAVGFEESTKAWEQLSVDEWKRQLRELPPGDFTSFKTLRDNYTKVPGGELDDEELNWFKRTYDAMKSGDIDAARAARAVLRSDPYWAKQVQRWEESWATRTIADAITKAESRAKSDPIGASGKLHEIAMDLAQLGLQEKALAKLKVQRMQTFQAGLAATQREALDLLKKGRYQSALAVTEKLKKELANEAKALRQETELAQLVDSYGFLADLARQAGKSDPK